MAPTGTAVYQQASTQQGSTLATAYTNPSNLDLLQIVSKKGGAVLLNVDHAGAVHKPASGATGDTIIGDFATNFQSSDNATVAQLFADTFSNPSKQDIIQAINIGGNVHYYLDFQGVAHGS
jgi:hypothetical protein